MLLVPWFMMSLICSLQSRFARVLAQESAKPSPIDDPSHLKQKGLKKNTTSFFNQKEKHPSISAKMMFSCFSKPDFCFGLSQGENPESPTQNGVPEFVAKVTGADAGAV